MRVPLWLCLAAVAGLAAVGAQELKYPNPQLSKVQLNYDSCVVERHAVYYNETIETLKRLERTDRYDLCCAKCAEYTRNVTQAARGQAGEPGSIKTCNLWTWCERAAGGQNCTLPADVVDPPAWTEMAPGECVLQYLKEAEKGFSNSPRLNGQRQNASDSLNYWTGGALPKNVIGDITVLAGSLPNYYVFQGIELTLAYDWVDCPDDTPYGPVALGATPYSYCWRKGTPSDLINYCNQHPECDALTLFFNGFSLSPKYAHCWASAFFKTARGSGGNLSLSTKLTLSPQAALFVKTSSWSPSPSDSGNPNASEFTASSPGSLAAQQVGMPISSYSMAPNWTCVFNNTGDDTSVKEIYSSSGILLERDTLPAPDRESCPKPVPCPDYTCAPAARLFQVTNATFVAFGQPRKTVLPNGESIFQSPADCCEKCRNNPECKHWVSCGVEGGCGAGCNSTVLAVGLSVADYCWGGALGTNWPSGTCILLRDPPHGSQLGVLQMGPNTLWVSGTPYTVTGRTLSAGMIAGTAVSALVLVALGIAGIVLFRRHRRRRPKYVFDEPDAAAENKKGTSGTNGGTSSTYGTTSSSSISTELRKAAFHIDPKDIIIEQNEHGNIMLGKGAFGEVYAATWFQTKVAVKYLTKEGGEAEKEFLNEIKVMAESFHQNIVTFYSACMEPHRFLLVYEFMAAGDLTKALARDQAEPRRLGWYGIGLKILLDVARGLAFLHSRRVIHYDIKSSNILLDTLSKHVTAKIADVGLSRIMQATQATLTDGHFMRGTEAYMAPELFEYGAKRPTTAVDMFSYGVLMWEVVTGERPWMIRGSMLRDFECGPIIVGDLVPDEAPAAAFELYKALVSHDARERPTALDVIECLEPLQPNFNHNSSLPLSAGTSLPGSLPSVDSRGNAQPWASHRRNISG